MEPIIRIATLDDFEAIYELLEAGHEESKIAELDAERARVVIKNCMTPEMGGAASVAIVNGYIVGSIGLFVTQPIWSSKEWGLVSMWHYVHPEYRRSTIAVGLLTQAEKAAKELGLRLWMGLDSPENVDGKRRLYERRYRLIGYLYVGGE